MFSNSKMIAHISKYSWTLKQFHSVILIAPVSSAGRFLAGKKGGWFLTLAGTAAKLLPDNTGLNNVSRTCEACAGKSFFTLTATVCVLARDCGVTAIDHLMSLQHRSAELIPYQTVLCSSSMAILTGFCHVLCEVVCDEGFFVLTIFLLLQRWLQRYLAFTILVHL
jgi:hypothetical protein